MGALLSALLARLVTPCLIDRETGKQVQEAVRVHWLQYIANFVVVMRVA